MVFVDSNVVIYWKDGREPAKQRAAENWMTALADGGTGRVSFQVLQESYVNLVRIGLAPPDARTVVTALNTWRPLAPDFEALSEAWLLCDQFSLSFWDALIVASARISRCRYLLTEDLQNGQDFGGLRVIDPFAHAPEEILRA